MLGVTYNLTLLKLITVIFDNIQRMYADEIVTRVPNKFYGILD